MESERARLDWFKEILLPHEAALRNRLRRVLPRHVDVDDLVSETMTRAYGAGEFTRITNGRAYLFQIARNLVIDDARRAQIVSFNQIADVDLIASNTSAEALLEARDELRRLEEIVASLPIQCRRAFILRRVYGKSVIEIAEEMGLAVSTVDKHLGRATIKVMEAIRQFEEFGFGRSSQERRGVASDQRGSGSSVS